MKRDDADVARGAIAAILRLTKLEKMRSIYEALEPARDGAVHSFQNPAGTETTRFSHSGTWLFEPGSYNLATLPKKTALADPLYRVRDCIIPHPGRLLGAADYSQAEARWCAWIANDPVRIKIYTDGIDHYKFFVAAMKWDDPTRHAEVTKAERNSIGKVGTLSGQYQVGWQTLMTSVNDDFDLHGVAINAATAKRMAEIWPALFPRTFEWWREVEEQVLTHGFTVNPFGRKRFYFGRRDAESGKRAVVREAIADGPQSANAMALNGALRRLYEKHDPHLMRLLLNVHDELVFDFAPSDMRRVAAAVRAEMEIPFNVDGRTLVIPAEIKMSSKSWGEMRGVACRGHATFRVRHPARPSDTSRRVAWRLVRHASCL